MNTFETKLSAVLLHFLSLHEAEAVAGMLDSGLYSADDIFEYIDWCKRRYGQDLTTDFEEWLEDRKPRILISYCTTEYGHPISGMLTYPARKEPDYEWYYSLNEIRHKIMALKVGETIPFKIRDDKDSVGSVTRLK